MGQVHKMTKEDAWRFNRTMAFLISEDGTPKFMDLMKVMAKRNMAHLSIYEDLVRYGVPFTGSDIIGFGYSEPQAYRFVKELEELGLIERLFKIPPFLRKTGVKGNGPRPQLWGLL